MPTRSASNSTRCKPWLAAAIIAAATSFSMPVGADSGQPAAIVSARAGGDGGIHATGSRVEEGQQVTTGAAENLALVLQDDALLELCSRSVVTLQRHAVRKAQIIKLDAGEARFVVSPRSPDERIEVHTPSAIATILGTVVMVRVDPVTGETTVSSEESTVEVRSNDPAIAGSTRVTEGERCVVPAGDAPSGAEKLERAAFASLGDCLLDLENAALARDRIARRKKDIQNLAMTDVGEIDLPTVATPGGGVDIGGLPSPTDPDTLPDPTTANPIPVRMEEKPEMPEIEMPPPPPPCMVAACMPGANI